MTTPDLTTMQEDVTRAKLSWSSGIDFTVFLYNPNIPTWAPGSTIKTTAAKRRSNAASMEISCSVLFDK